MSRIKIRRVVYNDMDDVTDLFMHEGGKGVMLGLDGRPILWHVEQRQDWPSSFYVTYLQVEQ